MSIYYIVKKVKRLDGRIYRRLYRVVQEPVRELSDAEARELDRIPHEWFQQYARRIDLTRSNDLAIFGMSVKKVGR